MPQMQQAARRSAPLPSPKVLRTAIPSACRSGAGLEPTLIRLIDPPPELDEDAYLLMHRDLKDVPAIRGVAKALVDVFRRNAAVLAGRVRGGNAGFQGAAM